MQQLYVITLIIDLIKAIFNCILPQSKNYKGNVDEPVNHEVKQKYSYPTKFPKWAEPVTELFLGRTKNSIKFSPNCKLFRFLRSQYPDNIGTAQHPNGPFMLKGCNLFMYKNLLYLNKFVKLNDDEIRLLGKYAIKDVVDTLNAGHYTVWCSILNCTAFLVGGVIYRYAKLVGAEEEVIEEIKTFAKCFRMHDDFVIYPYDNFLTFNYSDGTQRKILHLDPDMPPLEIVYDDPVFE
ncbi:hypothetical protein TVAG_460810 [Trichomonas vaginalis G3]|uniref:Initiator binding domain-containing protein n=1 Tax=Trichomonas vaginalis (strain ATCC PRA-98 / G3) TaxID=412133 RepID=A2DY55_TRIV3|nr:hypothetical protein TVAGG3_0644580 [Trichomonas vaginalis G3]EAY14664.1 hypothetical protein TVAG_460810 [Trichomonas vaginalis G3]KAI5505414.1 hypothetical protein TVAGG3_0644580 [Trichomonas vaginalis G3]|eukprot:XP_001326887.1 hypothetical protein [Trichomonas vaginalis G3]